MPQIESKLEMNHQASPKPVATKANLSLLAAVWNAFWGREIEFYPRIASEGMIETMETLEVVDEFNAATERWDFIEGNQIGEALTLARQSLDEVKEQTAYQDQKAMRLLTVTTFLSAMSGLLFTRFQDGYPLDAISNSGYNYRILVILSYASFSAFVMTALSGALVIFHATRTRFKYPPFEIGTTKQEEDPRSLLFHAALVRVRPRAWANAWVAPGRAETDDSRPALRPDLQQRYLQNLVGETFLVAAKTSDKLRYLQPAQSLLAISLRCLFVWLILLGVISTTLPPTKAAVVPTEIKLVTPSGLAPIEVRSVPSQPSSPKGTTESKEVQGVRQPQPGAPKQ